MFSFSPKISETFQRQAKRYQTFFIPKDRVDVNYDDTPISAGTAYCRLWLEEMCLAKDIEWFKHRYPVVHSAIRFNHGKNPITVPCLVKPGTLQELAPDNLDKVIIRHCALTPLFPFNGGLIELQAGLFSMEASDPINKFIQTMDRFSQLLPVPEISTVLKIVQPIYQGIEDLIGVGKSELELGYQDTFCPAGGGSNNDLKSGYFMAILAEENEVNPNNLCVVDSKLRLESSLTQSFTRNSKPLEGYSYMLFRIEKQTEQDWESLTNINDLFEKAQEAVFEGKYEEVKKTLIPAVRSAIYRSPDVAKADRKVMTAKIEDYLKEIGLEGQTKYKSSLYSIMQRPLPELDTKTEGELNALEAIFSQ